MTPQPSGLCQNCHERPATKVWLGEGGSLALVHGFGQNWCAQCVTEAQLKFARERAADIPRLEAQLADILANGDPA